MITIPVSHGQLYDQMTILVIKHSNIADQRKKWNVANELDRLSLEFKRLMRHDTASFNALMDVNSKLWDIEDRIREKEAAQAFDDEFIQLARSIYHLNDYRAKIKRAINLFHDSTIIEEKQYSKYEKGVTV